MKKRTILSLLLALSLSVMWGQSSVNSLFNKYNRSGKYEVVNVNSTMLKVARGMADKETREVLKKVSHIKVITSGKGADVAAFIADSKQVVSRQRFESLAEVRDKGVLTNIYFKETGQGNTELLVVSKEDDKLNAVWIKGKLHPDDFEKMRGKQTSKK